MSIDQHTFQIAFPATAIEDDLGECLTAGNVSPAGHVVVLIDSTMFEAAKTRAEQKGWIYVGAGDQRPAAVSFTQTYSTSATTIPAYTPPTIAGNYAAGVLSLLNAASNDNLNDLAGKVATLQAHVEAGIKALNGLIDALQAGRPIS